MKPIKSADLVNYNANSRGTSTGDCSVRAISLAFNKDYREVKQILNESAKRLRAQHYNSSKNIVEVISNVFHQGKYIDIREQKLTVEQFADQHPSGIYLIGCGRTPDAHKQYSYSLGGHIVTIINGKVFDTWDSRDWYVIKYWKVSTEETTTRDSELITLGEALSTWAKGSKEWWREEVESSFNTAVARSRRLKKIVADNNIRVDFAVTANSFSYRSFVFKVTVTFDLQIPEYRVSEDYTKVIKVAIKPDTKPEDIESYIKSAFDIKMNDSVWAIVKSLEDIVQGYNEMKDIPEGNATRYWMSSYEQKIFNGLPYWVRRIATYFSVEKYSYNGYELILTIQSLPNDVEGEFAPETHQFRAFSRDDLVDMLEEYKKTGDFEAARDLY
jgi:hypothetical protein